MCVWLNHAGAQWERDRQVNSDSSGTEKRGKAKRELHKVCMRERETGSERELRREGEINTP